MHILTPDNKAFDMNQLPETIDYDLRYCVLDYSDQRDVDMFFVPLIFRDVFQIPAADLRIGQYRLQMPMNWSVVIADKNFGNMEVIELKHLNDRDFDVFIMNPVSSFMPSFEEISIQNIYPDITWDIPKLKFGHLLAVPLDNTDKPPCAFFVKDVNRLPDSLDIRKIFS